MKEKHLGWICIAVFTCIIGLALMGAAANPETEMVKTLLEKRTDIMGNVLSGNITYEEGKEQLKEIEAEKLYNDDLKNLQAYQDTDYEEIRHMKFIKMEKKSHIYDMMTFSGEIDWTYDGYDGRYTQQETYYISVREYGDGYKLISFEIQEKSD